MKLKLSNLFFFFIFAIIFASDLVLSSLDFKSISQFSLGPNVLKAKFSPDYSVLAVLKNGQNAIYSYNPFTFQLIGIAYLQGSMFPQDLQLFGTDIILAAQPNTLLVYQRKLNSPQLILKQMITTKINKEILGVRLQKLNQDFDDKSNSSQPRHFVLRHKQSFQVYKYISSEDTNKLTFLFSKSYQSTNQNVVDAQFHDQKFLIFGLETAGAGKTQLLLLSSPNDKQKEIDTKLLFGIKSFRAKTASNYLAISYASGIGQWKTNRNSIEKGKNDISNGTSAKIVYDNNRFIGFYNKKYIQVFKDTDNITTGYPSYESRFSKNSKEGEPQITLVAMPQNYTGQFIANDCAQKDCFNYYSLCAFNEYYYPNGGLLNNTQICKKCNSTTNCQKCYQDNVCVKCLNGYFLNSTKKCQTCATTIIGCAQCTQNGTCYKCDQNKYNPQPLSGECQCKAGSFYDSASKDCVLCKNKVPFCELCVKIDVKIQCLKCNDSANRILNPTDNGSCICNQFYFENTNKQCQLCDNQKKCSKCLNTTFCVTCNADNKWKVDSGKCVCADKFIQEGNQCVECKLKGCQQCITQQTCKTCSQAQGYDPEPKNSICVCQSDRIFNQQTETCELCSVYIPGCKNCPNMNKCEKCDQTKNRIQAPNNQGKCDCQTTYTQNNERVCVLCSTAGCLHCQTQNQCTKCNNDEGFNETISQGKCKCIQTKYLDNQTCVDCFKAIDGCQNCKDSNVCTKCQSQNGFNETLQDDKCVCVDTMFLQDKSCKVCSSAVVGCQNCKQKSTCLACNSTGNFVSQPEKGRCKCIQNYFVKQNQCQVCSNFCQHCQMCVEIINQGLFTTSIGCMKCSQEFDLSDGKCVDKPSSVMYYIISVIAVFVILTIVLVIYCKKRKARKDKQSEQQKKLSDIQDISMILKQGSQDVLSSDRSSGQRKSYEQLFSGNINYSISSQERQSDKQSFNQSLRQADKEKQKQYLRKSKGKQGPKYSDLMKTPGNRRPQPNQEQEEKKMKQNLFSHKGKG